MEKVAIFSVLRIPEFRNLWISQLLSQVALNVIVFALVIRVYELTHSNQAVSLMVVTSMVPNILFGAVAGLIVDQLPRKTIMFISHFLRIFVVLAFLMSSENLFWIYLMTILIGTISQFFAPAESATIPALIKDKTLLLMANGLFSLTFFGSVILGNVLAGPLLDRLGMTNVFLLMAGAYGLAAVFISRIPGRRIRDVLARLIFGLRAGSEFIQRRVMGQEGVLVGFLEGIDHVYRTRSVRQGMLIVAIGQILVGILISLAPGIADEVLGVRVSETSVVVMAPAAIGMILGAVFVGQFFPKSSREALIRAGFFTGAIFLFLFSQVSLISQYLNLPIVGVSFIMIFLLGGANSFLEVPVNTLIQENTPLKIRSRIFGLLSSIIGVTSILPIILAGLVADVFGVRAVILIVSLTLLGVSVYNELLIRRVSDSMAVKRTIEAFRRIAK